ncbi:SPOR domain-containing protein [Vibrio splendidus]|uniref:SPOR domain-containing protein n=1 Tax=Vibrio splendidus TaxID=29497 RepID=UPI00352E774A
MRWFPLTFLLLFSSSLYALPEEGKSTDTSDLGLFLTVTEDCPFEYSTLKHSLDGEFLRARISPNRDLDHNLSVYVTCIATRNGNSSHSGYAINVDTRFGTRLPNGDNVLFETPNYGALLIGGTSDSARLYFTNYIKESVSTALTDYLAENIKGQNKHSSNSSHFLLQLMVLREEGNAIKVKKDLTERGFTTSIINSHDFFRIVISGKAKEPGDVVKIINELEEITGSKAKQIE